MFPWNREYQINTLCSVSTKLSLWTNVVFLQKNVYIPDQEIPHLSYSIFHHVWGLHVLCVEWGDTPLPLNFKHKFGISLNIYTRMIFIFNWMYLERSLTIFITMSKCLKQGSRKALCRAVALCLLAYWRHINRSFS